MHSLTTRALMPAISFVVILAVWQCASTLRWVNPVLLPPPSAIAPVAASLLTTGEFLAPLVQTLWLLCAGYALACVSGVLVGLLVGMSERAHCLLEPLIEAIRPLPKPALIPIFFLFLGPGSAMKIAMVSLAAFFPVLINTMQGVRGVDRVLLDTASTLGLSSFTISPFADHALKDGDVVRTADPYTEVQPTADIGHFVTTEEFFQKNQEAIRKFSRALRKGVQFVNANFKAAETQKLISTVTRLTPEVVATLPQIVMPERIFPEEYARTMALMVDAGLLKSSVDLASLIDTAQTR